MSCSACSARVEKAVSKVPGVTSCTVSLLTNSMGVEGTASPESIMAAVKAAGYKASLKKGAGKPAEQRSLNSGAAEQQPQQTTRLRIQETPQLWKRLTASVILLLILMYFSMGHMMWGWPVPAALADNHVAMGILQLLLTRHCYGNQPKVFHKRISEPLAQSTEHGYAGCTWCDGGVCVERGCAFSDDGCADARRYARRDDLYG